GPRRVLAQPQARGRRGAGARPRPDSAIRPRASFAGRVAPAVGGPTRATPASAVPGAQTGIQWQVQGQVDPQALAGSPAHALTRATQIRNSVESSLPGQVQFFDNLAHSLTTAASGPLFAETLYIMLTAPGSLVARSPAYLR